MEIYLASPSAIGEGRIVVCLLLEGGRIVVCLLLEGGAQGFLLMLVSFKIEGQAYHLCLCLVYGACVWEHVCVFQL